MREVLAFPFLREEKQAPKEKFAAELVDVQPLPEEGIRKFMLLLHSVLCVAGCSGLADFVSFAAHK
jgi:hypothetical protein